MSPQAKQLSLTVGAASPWLPVCFQHLSHIRPFRRWYLLYCTYLILTFSKCFVFSTCFFLSFLPLLVPFLWVLFPCFVTQQFCFVVLYYLLNSSSGGTSRLRCLLCKALLPGGQSIKAETYKRQASGWNCNEMLDIVAVWKDAPPFK